MPEYVNFRKGSLELFNRISNKQDNTLYFVEDIGKIYKGSVDITSAFRSVTSEQYEELTVANTVPGLFYVEVETLRIKVREKYSVSGEEVDHVVELFPGVIADDASGSVIAASDSLVSGKVLNSFVDGLVESIQREIEEIKDGNNITVDEISPLSPGNTVLVVKNGETGEGLADSGYKIGGDFITEDGTDEYTLATEAAVINAINEAFRMNSF